MSWVSMFGVEDPLNTEGPQRETWKWWEQLADDAKDTANEGLDALEGFMQERRDFFKHQTRVESLLGTGITEGLTTAEDFARARKGAVDPITGKKLKIGMGLKETLFSPGGQAVDQLMKYAKNLSGGLTDPENKEWNELFGSLTEGPLSEIEAGLTNTRRSLSRDAAAAEGEMQDLSRSRGAARDPYAEREQVGRLNEAMAGTQAEANTAAGAASAQIKSGAQQFMRQYVPKLTSDTVNFAHNWVFGGGRQQYIADMGMAITSFATASMQASAIFSDLGRASLGSFTNIVNTEQTVRAALFQAANDALSSAIGSSVSSIGGMVGG